MTLKIGDVVVAAEHPTLIAVVDDVDEKARWIQVKMKHDGAGSWCPEYMFHRLGEEGKK